MLIRKRTALAAGLISLGLPVGVTAQEPKDGSGKEIFVQRCSACHELTTATVRRSSGGEWREIVDRMIMYGAALTDPEKEKLVGYLAKSYGPDGAAAASSRASDKPAH